MEFEFPQSPINTTDFDSRYKQLIDDLPAAIYTCDAEGYIKLYNQAAVELWGRTPVPGDLWCGSWKIFKTDGTPMPLDECPMAVALKEGRAIRGVEIIIECPDGTRRNVLPHPKPIFNNKGEIVEAVNMLVDITERRQSERIERILLEEKVKARTRDYNILNEELLEKNTQLQDSEERYHRMISEVQDYAIILLDKEGTIQNWNKGAEKIKGYSPDEIVGQRFDIFYLQEDRENNLPQKSLNEAYHAGRATSEGARLRKDGSAFWASVVITALHDNDNNVVGFSKVTRDLTELKRYQDSLKQSAEELEQKNIDLKKMNDELSSFAYVSSHDLQEPLRKIQVFIQRLISTEYDNLSEKGKDTMQRIENSALRMKTLIHDLLSYSRITTSERKFELVDLQEVINQVKDQFQETIREKNAILDASSLRPVTGVSFQLHQLFHNLISNSLKFSRKDTPPYIVIRGEIIPGTSHKFLLQPERSYYHIIIQDNGIGFEPEYTSKIFEVFQRLHGVSEYKGTGIGLAICKKIAEAHGGYIRAESELNKGATFHLYLPL